MQSIGVDLGRRCFRYYAIRTFNFTGEKSCFSLSQRRPQSVTLVPRGDPAWGSGVCCGRSCRTSFSQRCCGPCPPFCVAAPTPPTACLLAVGALPRRPGGRPGQGPAGTHPTAPTEQALVRSGRKQTSQAPAAAHKTAFGPLSCPLPNLPPSRRRRSANRSVITGQAGGHGTSLDALKTPRAGTCGRKFNRAI